MTNKYVIQKHSLNDEDRAILQEFVNSQYYPVVQKYLEDQVAELATSHFNTREDMYAYMAYGLQHALEGFRGMSIQKEYEINPFEESYSITDLQP